MIETTRKTYKLYDSGVVLPITELSDTVENLFFKVTSGSRILFDVYVKSITPGSSASINFKNNFVIPEEQVVSESILTLNVNAVGHHKRIVTDFQQFFEVGINVVGEVELGLAISVFDNSLKTNLDGSINVNVVSSVFSNEVEKNITNEVAIVPPGVETDIVSYTVPLNFTAKIQNISFSGSSIGTFSIYKNNELIDRKHTWFSGPLFGDFKFHGAAEEGQTFVAGDVIKLKVIHSRTPGDFIGRIQLLEIG